MIYVVYRGNGNMEHGTILNKCDAWEVNGEERMIRWAREAGWIPTGSEITMTGDMIIWVE